MRLDELKGPRTLYVSRKVKNTQDIVEWAKQQGLKTMLHAKELHVTICYSKEPFDWSGLKPDKEEVKLPALDDVKGKKPLREIEMFGKDHDVLVIQIESEELAKRHAELRKAGASSDFPDYKPHVTITYNAADLAEDHKSIEPYRGEIIFGPEVFKEIDEDWSDDAPEMDLTESIIMEAKVVDSGRESGVKVWKSVTPRQLIALSSQSDLRGIITREATYVWYAEDDYHHSVANRLALRPLATFYVVGADDSGMHDGGRSEWGHGRREPHFKLGRDCLIYCSNYRVAKLSDSFMAMIGGQFMLAESRDEPEDLPERFWLNAETEKFLDCGDEDHAEYAEKHHRKMKLPLHETTEIVPDALHEFEDLAMEHDWVKGEGRTLTASKVENLNKAADYFVRRWPGEKLTLVLDGRWRTEVSAKDVETLTGDLIHDIDLDESANAAPAPRKFWLVFDLPHNSPHSVERANRHVATLHALGQGHLNDVKGISDSREIITGFLAVARNAALVMDGTEVMRLNDIERIAYEDPEYLVSNNMTALYRIWDKRPDRIGYHGMMQNLMEYVNRGIKQWDPSLADDLKYNGFPDKVAAVWTEHALAGKTISTLDELREFIIAAIREVAGKKDRWSSHYESLFREIDPDTIERGVWKGLKQIAHIYGDEGEWIVRSPQFNIPQGSVLLILVSKTALARFDAWKRNPPKDSLMHDPAMESLDNLMNVIHEYDLDRRYQIRFVDSQQFDRVRGNVLTRRGKKRSGQN